MVSKFYELNITTGEEEDRFEQLRKDIVRTRKLLATLRKQRYAMNLKFEMRIRARRKKELALHQANVANEGKASELDGHDLDAVAEAPPPASGGALLENAGIDNLGPRTLANHPPDLT